jgi:serine/threonine-protein kinase
MAAIAPASCAELLELLKRSGVLAADRVKALPCAEDLPPEPTKAASVLVREGFITRFQAAQLLAGRHKGFRIGQYIIQDLLGRGGMGAVYLAEHLDLHRKVAIKVLAPAHGDDQRLATERFLREARAAAALDHPNIVRIFDVARHNDAPYLVMEYIEGETLQETLDRDHAVPYDVAAEYAAQAASGLQHAHEKGFIHRDIKPGNLVRDRFGVVRILDMGLARSASEKDKLTEKLDEGAVVGTADFIAPEQAINSPSVDGRADIYSLGATLFTLIAGKPPFDGNTTQKLMQHQLKDAPTLRSLNPEVPQELSDIVAKMLSKKAAERVQSATEVIAALAPWTGNSARVLAGLSRTKLAQSADVQSALSDWSMHGSSLKLRKLPSSGSSSELSFDPAEVAKVTAAMSSAETARSRAPELPTPPPIPISSPSTATTPALVPAGANNRIILLAAGGVAFAVLLAGILIGWLAFGR